MKADLHLWANWALPEPYACNSVARLVTGVHTTSKQIPKICMFLNLIQ